MKALIMGLVTAMFIVGCGGGGSSAEQSMCGEGSNSGNMQNQYGYFSGSTKFCKYSAARDWGLIDIHGGDVLVLRLSNDGEYLITDGHDVLGGNYGISLDRETMKAEDMNNISILRIRKNYYKHDGHNAVDCYEISGGDRDILMCPYPVRNSNMKKMLKKKPSHSTNMFGLIK